LLHDEWRRKREGEEGKRGIKAEAPARKGDAVIF